MIYVSCRLFWNLHLERGRFLVCLSMEDTSGHKIDQLCCSKGSIDFHLYNKVQLVFPPAQPKRIKPDFRQTKTRVSKVLLLKIYNFIWIYINFNKEIIILVSAAILERPPSLVSYCNCWKVVASTFEYLACLSSLKIRVFPLRKLILEFFAHE